MGSKPEVVVITGASAGIGRATVRRFAEAGAHISLLARGKAGLEAAKREVEERGGRALVVPTDVADADAVEAAAAAVENEFGPIDVWINNAMTSVFSPVKQMTPADYKRVTDVTYLGTVYGTLAALRRMQPRNVGSIVQVGSALAYRGIPLQSAYCGAKHAIQGFCDSLRAELLHDESNVKLTMVQLPGVNTPQFDWVKNRLPNKGKPIGGVYQPEVAAEAIFWAAHNDRRELIVGVPALQAVIGNKFAPQLGDWALSKIGFDGQQRENQPEDPDRPDNLYEPVDDARDFGAHGVFEEQARTFSPQLWATTHRGAITGAFAALGVIGGGLYAAALRAGKKEGENDRG